MDYSLWLAVLYYILPVTYSALYSNLWAVHIEGGERVARSVAESTGFTYLNKVSGLLSNVLELHSAPDSSWPKLFS